MNNHLVQKTGDSPVENLINSTTPPALTTGINIVAGQGALTRGTVLALDSDGNGAAAVLGAPGSDGLTAMYILCDPADTGDGEAVPAVVYRSGHFNRPALVVAEGYIMTRKDEENLRNGGILLSGAMV